MWILQNNIWKEEKYSQVAELLERYEIPYQIVNLIPFSESLELPCDAKDIEMAFGSIRFIELAQKQGVKIHFNDNFNYEVWSKVFENYCLNWDSKITTIGELNLPLDYDVFIRPVLDDKSFSGTVLRAGDNLDSIQFATSKVKEDIKIQVAPIKNIYQEFRFFVVNGKVITGSLYRVGRQVRYSNVDHLSGDAEYFAQMMVIKWCPSEMFVIDIADTSDGLKIIEFGSIHNCGFYDIDLSKLIQEIQCLNIANMTHTP